MASLKQKWFPVRDAMLAGNMPAVFINVAGRVCFDGGADAGKEMPPALVELLPASDIEAAKAKQAGIAAADQIERDRQAAERAAVEARMQAVIDQFRSVRCWRLNGLYVDDASMARYTFREIMAWIDWDAYNLRHNDAVVSCVCERSAEAGGDFHVDLSGHFANVCNDRRKTPSFDTLCIRLREYVAERRANAAPNN